MVHHRLVRGLLVSEELEHLGDVVHRDDRLGGRFTNCEMLTVVAQGHGGYAFGALDAGDEFLSLVLHGVNHNVVATGVADNLVVEEEEISLDIAFVTEEELGSHCNLSVSRSLLGRNRSNLISWLSNVL